MKMNWFERLATALGGGQQGARHAVGASKHERGYQRPRGWHTALRRKRKRKRQRRARQMQRGKRGN